MPCNFGCVPSQLAGRRFGRLVVLSRAENSKTQKTRWLCLCDCGKEKVIGASELKRGGRAATQSCGCLALKKVRGEYYAQSN